MKKKQKKKKQTAGNIDKQNIENDGVSEREIVRGIDRENDCS